MVSPSASYVTVQVSNGWMDPSSERTRAMTGIEMHFGQRKRGSIAAGACIFAN